MRKNPTWPEKILWSRLRGKRLGVVFYRQKILCGFIADFWCPSCKIVVEVDGACHGGREAYDMARDIILKTRGILTMRFSASEVNRNPAAVVALIGQKARERTR